LTHLSDRQTESIPTKNEASMPLAPRVLPSVSPRRNGPRIRNTLVVGFFLAAVIACGDDSTSPAGNTIVGIWDAATFSALGTDLIADGMSLTVSINGSGNYTFAFTNDLVGACDPGPNCTQAGTYEVTGNNVTFDPTNGDSFDFDFSFQQSGSKMTWTGLIDGNAATITFDES